MEVVVEMEIVLFILIFVVAVIVLAQPIWRKIFLKNEDVEPCESQNHCQSSDCKTCPLPSTSHLQTYIEAKYGAGETKTAAKKHE